MLKVKLNLDPTERPTFTATVQIPTDDGSKLAIPWVFKARTRIEVGQWLDASLARAKAAMPEPGAAEASAEQPALSLEAAMREATLRDIEAVREVAEDWLVEGLPFTDVNLGRLFNAYPGAAGAVLSHYQVSVTKGRLGN